jgi:hypothetical protein
VIANARVTDSVCACGGTPSSCKAVMGALPTLGLLREMSMKQTELITGVGGEQGICRESGVRTVPGTGTGDAAWTGVRGDVTVDCGFFGGDECFGFRAGPDHRRHRALSPVQFDDCDVGWCSDPGGWRGCADSAGDVELCVVENGQSCGDGLGQSGTNRLPWRKAPPCVCPDSWRSTPCRAASCTCTGLGSVCLRVRAQWGWARPTS